MALILTIAIPLFFTSLAYGENFILSWDQNPEEELAGYYLYIGTSSRTYNENPLMLPKESLSEVNGRVSYQFPLTVAQGVTYYFTVTAYDTFGYETDFSNEVQFPLPGDGADVIPPTGTVTINNGDEVTYSLNTILTLSATDDGRELDENGLMTFSNDGEVWSAPEPYATGKLWTLLPGKGEKTVYVKFRDAAGNWMTEPAQDGIYYEASETACDNPQKLSPESIAASSQFLPLYPIDNAFDGNPTTTWSTFSFLKREEFVSLDLGGMKRLSGITMYASKMFGIDYFPTNFQIQISRDSSTWATINNEQGYTPPLQSPYRDNWNFEIIECRYIRVYITKAKSLFFFFQAAQIAEIEVYGCDIEDDIPLVSRQAPALSSGQEESGSIAVEGSIHTRQEILTPPGRPEVRFE